MIVILIGLYLIAIFLVVIVSLYFFVDYLDKSKRARIRRYEQYKYNEKSYQKIRW